MSELTLYTHPMSRGRIVRWTIEEIGVPYQTEIVNYGADMKSGTYKAINPMGKVPAIKHGNTIVTETAAICAYLADAFPAANLAPALENRGLYYRWPFFTSGPLEMATFNRAAGLEIPADKQRMAGCGSYEDVMDTLEFALCENEYVAGGQFTAADIYIGAVLNWGLQFGSIEKRKPFSDYVDRLIQRPACQRAGQMDDEAAKKLQASG